MRISSGTKRTTNQWLDGRRHECPSHTTNPSEIKDYWNIPGLLNWLSLKEHLAFGWFTDGYWKKDLVAPVNYYTKVVRN